MTGEWGQKAESPSGQRPLQAGPKWPDVALLPWTSECPWGFLTAFTTEAQRHIPPPYLQELLRASWTDPQAPTHPQAAHCLCSLGIYSLPPLPLSGPPVATRALPRLCSSLFLDLRRSKGPNAQEVLRSLRQPLKVGWVQGTNGRKWVCSGRLREGGSEGLVAPTWSSQVSGRKRPSQPVSQWAH